MEWKNRYGFVGVNAAGLPYATDGMNEAGLTVGVLFFPGFAEFQELKRGPAVRNDQQRRCRQLSAQQFRDGGRSAAGDAEDSRRAQSRNREGVRHANPDPSRRHRCDGRSIVIEYTKGTLSIYDNKVGAMTNSPNYDWHLLNLRNYTNLTAAGRTRFAQHRRRVSGAIRRRKRNARIARRFHAAVTVHPRRGIRQYDGAG